LLDELSSDARAIRAVNTVIFKNSRRFGHNTDWSGFAESFRRSLPDVSRERIVQLGAGGAGAAVAHALLTLGAGELSIVDTERQRAASLAEALRARYGADRARAIEDVPTAISGADGVVNATPVGMGKFPGLPIEPSLLRPRHWVADVVYFPLETELLREAKVRGCRTMSGAGMAVFQAAEAFRLFSGEEPNQERMLLHFENM
jgi:shikimate dehydrogenase